MPHPSPTPLSPSAPHPAFAVEDLAETIREDHLRLAVLLDLIEDELAAAKPLSGRLAQLRTEYDRHAIREEDALARLHPGLLESHRQRHNSMRMLLIQLSAAHDGGRDISDMLRQVVGMFVGQLMPADTIFTSGEQRPSAAS